MGAEKPDRLGLPKHYPSWVGNVVESCRSCGMPIVWGMTMLGKNCPYDADPISGKSTTVSHFTTCPDAGKWSKKKPKDLPVQED